MTSPAGYNNPAYNHQFDSSAYDYQYVPDIDPDYDGNLNEEHEQIHLVHPGFHDELAEGSEDFDASDESNQSIIVEECNNRRVTLICEKRSKTEEKFLEERNYNGAYYHDISLESEDDFRKLQPERAASAVTSRHKKRLDPPAETVYNDFIRDDDARNRNHVVGQTEPIHNPVYQRQQRQHRYEVIDDFEETKPKCVSRHRYAEITVDENGYPSIGREIEVEKDEKGYRIVNRTSVDCRREYPPRPIQKPRAASPVSVTFSPTFSPSKTYQRTISPHPSGLDVDPCSMALIKPTSVPSRGAPTATIEMAELSPPRDGKHAQTPYVKSPKRQPPIGASSPAEQWEQKKLGKHGKTAQNHQKAGGRNVTPSKADKPSVTQMFQVKMTPKTCKGSTQGKNSSRRNISQSFMDSPSDFEFKRKCSSPSRATLTDVGRSKTAIITPILQRRNKADSDIAGNNFLKMSHTFQSTGNLCSRGTNYQENEYKQQKETVSNKARMKRNRSVPNFAQSLANEDKSKQLVEGSDYQRPSPQKSVRKLDYQYSPAKSDRFSPIDRSRIYLIDQATSWSNSSSDFQPPASGCLLIGAVIQIITSIASCAICFYLFSKLGRRYYLDFGILAGFVNFVLGVLGFRSQCWKWLPNRNYVSGYILLTAFSIITCAGFVYLITARPMSGDPILDLMGGGICGVSVLTIILSVTGLTMSGCCKSPPPDNRVNNI